MKKWYQSKTIWFNLITILLGTIQVVTNTCPIPTDVLALLMGLGNFVLRLVTNTGIQGIQDSNTNIKG
jgi:hypothetical protein